MNSEMNMNKEMEQAAQSGSAIYCLYRIEASNDCGESYASSVIVKASSIDKAEKAVEIFKDGYIGYDDVTSVLVDRACALHDLGVLPAVSGKDCDIDADALVDLGFVYVTLDVERTTLERRTYRCSRPRDAALSLAASEPRPQRSSSKVSVVGLGANAMESCAHRNRTGSFTVTDITRRESRPAGKDGGASSVWDSEWLYDETMMLEWFDEMLDADPSFIPSKTAWESYIGDLLDDMRYAAKRLDNDRFFFAIADLGLWNGRIRRLTPLGCGLDSVLKIDAHYDCETRWFSDGKDFRMERSHHDGSNSYLFRSVPSEKDFDALLAPLNSLPYDEWESFISKRSSSVLPSIAKATGEEL